MNNPTTESSQNNGENGETEQNPNETDAQYTEGNSEETNEEEGLFDWLLNDRNDRRN